MTDSIQSMGGRAMLAKHGVKKLKEMAQQAQARMRELGPEFYRKREEKRQATLKAKLGPSYMSILMESVRAGRAKKETEAELTHIV